MEVLLVDDQAVTVQVYAAIVRKTFTGARVHIAVDLPEALQIATGRAARPRAARSDAAELQGACKRLERFRAPFRTCRYSSSRRAMRTIARRLYCRGRARLRPEDERAHTAARRDACRDRRRELSAHLSAHGISLHIARYMTSASRTSAS